MQRSTEESITTTKLSVRQKTPVAYAFTYLNSPATVKQYPKRLQAFFEFIGLRPGDDLEQQGQAFLDETRHNGQQWAQEQIVMFMDSIKGRVKQNNNTMAITA